MNKIITTAITVLLSCAFLFAENIDPYDIDAKFGWSENTGWLNLDPDTGDGVQVESTKLTGWIWAENVGWINLSCENNSTCGSAEFGVERDAYGKLSGYAWGENVGWINFDPYYPGEPRYNPCRVSIDEDGYFDGWAWGENIGWIRFDKTQAWDARVCIVTLEDLQNFAYFWLGYDTSADLNGTGRFIDMGDYSVFSQYWLNFCPDGWQLK